LIAGVLKDVAKNGKGGLVHAYFTFPKKPKSPSLVHVFSRNRPSLHAGEFAQLCKLVFGVLSLVTGRNAGVEAIRIPYYVSLMILFETTKRVAGAPLFASWTGGTLDRRF
jgi:hypothetical protein